MTVKDLVSIIIPAYNAAAFINDAIESALAQDYRPIEVIVVDDGSSDETASIAEKFGPPVICHRQQNGGPPVARNRGLLLARGEYIGFLDADDLYEPGRVKLQFDKLQQNPGVTIVMGRLMREQLDSEPGEPITFKPMEPDDFICLQLGLCLFRRTVFGRAASWKRASDILTTGIGSCARVNCRYQCFYTKTLCCAPDCTGTI